MNVRNPLTLDRVKCIATALPVMLILFVCLISAGVETIRLDPDYHLESWTTDNGLPQNSIDAIARTPDGYLWLATNDGLVRFDGVRFTTFNTGNFPALKSNRMQALAVSRDGGLWVGTEGGGVVVIKNGDTTSYTVKNGLASDYVTSLYQDRRGVMWITTRKGLNVYKNGKLGTFAGADDLSHNVTHAVFRDSRDDLWISSTDNVLNRFRDGNVTHFSARNGGPVERVSSIFEDSRGRIWFGALHGVYLWNGGAFTEIPTGPHNYISSIFEDHEGTVWAAGNRGGFFQLKNHTSISVSMAGLTGKTILSIAEDPEKNLWMGSLSSGLLRLKKTGFTTWSVEQGLTSPLTLSIHQDKEGIVWVGTNGKGVCYFKDGGFKPYPPVTGGHIWSSCTTRDGTRWFGTYRGGLIRVKDDREVTRFTQKDGLPGDIILALYEDSRRNLWIGSGDGGLGRLRNGVFENFGVDHGFKGESVISILEDREGVLWIGTSVSGLNRYQDGEFTHYSTANGLSANAVRSLHRDSDGSLWAGTYGGGLNRLKNGRWTAVTTEHGLFDNVVSCILEDDRGYFWMTCNRGVYRAKKSDLHAVADGKSGSVTCIYYDKDDGMINAECNGGFHPSGWKTKDGKLWFPTIRGVVAFNADEMPVNDVPPPVVIEKITADDKELSRRTGLVLPAATRSIEIHYTGLSFKVPGRVRFKYQLTGYDPDWRDVGDRRIAYYTNIPPGDYTFRVKACNSDGLWSTRAAAVSFYMAPRFYQTWWFYLLCAVAAVGLAAGISLLRTKQLNRRQKDLERLVAERTRELESKSLQLEHAARSKSDFLARMSHEIRTPMNGVIGFTEMLLDTGLDEVQRDYAQTISRSGEALVHLLNDILDFSKIEAGELALEAIDFDPELIAFDVCDIIRPRLTGKPVEIICHIADNVPGFVVADAGRFRQVLVNLMSNAAKFTEAGEITLSLDVEKREKDRVQLHVIVGDTGVGIPEGKLESIFNVFQQAEGSTTRKYGGTGLGLAICKQIAQLMEGDVWAESTPGVGSRFHFTAWTGRSEKGLAEEIVFRELAGKKVLVVDDNRNNLDILDRLLTQINMRVLLLDNPADVVPALRHSLAQEDPFDIAVIDILMPEIDGYRTARNIRALEPPLGDLPLLAFSSAMAKGAGNYKAAGFNGFLPKPVRRRRLLDMIRRLLGRPDAADGENHDENILTRHSLAESEKHSIHILLAEDNPVNQKLARFMFEQAGYRLTTANNGKEAVELYTASPARFDLILMDIHMPEMDGVEATKAIRTFEHSIQNSKLNIQNSNHVPIIAMTADSMKGDRERFLAAGMNDYISKPIRREKIFEMIKKWVLN